MGAGLTTAIADVTATPVWVDPFIGQYQMDNTACCPESILNANRSARWGASGTTGGRDTYMRDSDQLHFLAESPSVEHEPILLFAQECLDHYTKERKQAGNVPRFGMTEGYNILRYKPGEAYHAVHSDGGPGGSTANRHLTFTMFLNTITSGGELEFSEQGIAIPPVEGRGVIFPAAWMYAHRSLPAMVDRYIFSIFYGFPPQP